jgi:hypothetical protein
LFVALLACALDTAEGNHGAAACFFWCFAGCDLCVYRLLEVELDLFV